MEEKGQTKKRVWELLLLQLEDDLHHRLAENPSEADDLVASTPYYM